MVCPRLRAEPSWIEWPSLELCLADEIHDSIRSVRRLRYQAPFLSVEDYFDMFDMEAL